MEEYVVFEHSNELNSNSRGVGPWLVSIKPERIVIYNILCAIC